MIHSCTEAPTPATRELAALIKASLQEPAFNFAISK